MNKRCELYWPAINRKTSQNAAVLYTKCRRCHLFMSMYWFMFCNNTMLVIAIVKIMSTIPYLVTEQITEWNLYCWIFVFCWIELLDIILWLNWMLWKFISKFVFKKIDSISVWFPLFFQKFSHQFVLWLENLI